MTKGVLYARVSTKEQAEEGFSLSAQVKLVEEHATRHGICIDKQFVVPESARGTQERKTFSEMIAYVRRHAEITIVLCEKVDRITRNFKDAITIDDWLNEDERRSIHFIKQNLIIHKNSRSHEKFQWDIHLVLARNYSNNLSEEARKGLDEKAAQGRYPGSQKRGYITIDVQGHKEWVIDSSPDSEASFIKKAFELAATDNYSLRQIRLRLIEEGWKTKAHAPIAKSVLHRILSDPFYCGDFLWKGKRWTHAQHEPLVSRELFAQIQQHLKRKVTGKYRKHSFLFQGLMRCKECGRSIVAGFHKGHVYYWCTRFNTNCSQHTYVREEHIERQILSLLSGLHIRKPKTVEWIRQTLKDSHQDEMEYHMGAVRKLDVAAERNQRRLDSLYDDKLDGKIPLDLYERKLAQYSEEHEQILEARARHKHANISYFELGMNILELSQRAQEMYENGATMEERRRLLRIVFLNLNLEDGNIVPDYSRPFDWLAEGVKNEDWSGRRDLNPRPRRPERRALASCATPRSCRNCCYLK